MYYDLKNKNTSYYLEKDKSVIVPLSNIEVKVRRYSDFAYTAYNSMDGLKISIYKDTLIQLFEEDKKIANQIINLNYSHKDLINFTKMQIEKTCKEENCISYEKDLRKYRDRFGFYYGIGFNQIGYYYQTYDENYQKTYLEFNPSIFQTNPIGFFYNVPLTTLGDRLSIQAEVMTYSLEYQSASTDPKKLNLHSRIISLPFSVRYSIPWGFISPTIAVGKSISYVTNSQGAYDKLHRTQREGLFYDLAVDYKITKGISLFNILRVQSYSNLIGDGKKMANYSNTLKYHQYRLEYDTNVATIIMGVKF